MIVHRAGRPVKAGGVTIIPLERVLLEGSAATGALRGFAGLEPAGVAVLSARGLVIYDETGSLAPVLPRLEKFEGLRTALSLLAFPGRGEPG